MNLFQKTLNRSNEGRPPVWLMRQAGRYHKHYQELRKKHSFIELCKNAEIACETTMGPMRDFDFDAAILFSDLLFPLEAMGMGLDYAPGPKLSWHLDSTARLNDLQSGASLASRLEFQADAMKLIRRTLSQEKGLLGFVGGPLTLYCYAVEGSHSGSLASARAGLKDGRYHGFVERLFDLLAQNMALQARSGADTIAMMDTCAGEFSPEIYREFAVPAVREVLKRFHAICPGYPVLYYSKSTSFDHWNALLDLSIAGIGVDWKTDLTQVLERYADRNWVIQGNVDPHWLQLDSKDFESKTREVFEKVKKLDSKLRKAWVCGVGHGLMPETREENVARFVQLSKEVFR